MKRVVFGYGGGFPLEQETLMQIQEAYSEDMLEALFALWGLDATKKYLIKNATENEDGWLILPIKILVEGNEDSSIGQETIKPQLVRLLHNSGGTRVSIQDLKAGPIGELQYATGAKNKVYEEFVGKLVVSGGKYNLSDFIQLKTIKQITNEVANNQTQIDTIKEDYLPRDGAKPMTGDLHLGVDKPTVTNGEDGTKLIFKGTANNTDSVFINKHTPSSDITELRVSVGDNAHEGSKDAFVVGGSVYGQNNWKENFRVQTDGNIGIGVSNPSKRLEVDAKGESLKFKNLKTIASQTPLVIDTEGNVGKNTTGITSANFSRGMIMMWSGDPTTVPTGWVLCDGRTGISGVRIPDLRGRFVLGYDSRKPSTPTTNSSKNIENYGAIHNTGGLAKVQLTVAEMPSHSHKWKYGVDEDDDASGDSNSEFTLKKIKQKDYAPILNTGGDKPHENRPPYYVLAFIIYVGDYNLKPTVSAGEDKTIALPATSVTLSGTANDRDGTIASKVWSKISGATDAVIVNKNALTTQVTGLSEGNYIFKLTVTDNEGAVANDTVNVRVAPRIVVSPAFFLFAPGKLKTEVTITSTVNWKMESTFIGDNGGAATVTPKFGGVGETKVTISVVPHKMELRQGLVMFYENGDKSKFVNFEWECEPLLVPPSGGGGCFDLESDVLMANDKTKKLKNIVIGDELRVFDFVNTLPAGNEEFKLLSELMKNATKKVSKVVDFGTKTVKEYRKITLSNGQIVQVTPSHPILASRDKDEVAWLLPDDLRGGYYIVDKNGELVEIQSKKTVKEPLEIGILQLETGDNYFINGCMVHNVQIVRAEPRVSGDIEAKPITKVDALYKEAPNKSAKSN